MVLRIQWECDSVEERFVSHPKRPEGLLFTTFTMKEASLQRQVFVIFLHFFYFKIFRYLERGRVRKENVFTAASILPV